VVKNREDELKSNSLKLISSHFAGLVVTDQFEADLLAVIEIAHTGALNCGDVNEHVCRAVIRLNEAEALCGIEPLYCSSAHDEPFQWKYFDEWHDTPCNFLARFLKKDLSERLWRNKLLTNYQIPIYPI
jgi:hypothetical protein